MKWQLGTCRVVGGMRPSQGKAPFARGAAVLGREDTPDRFLQVHGFNMAEPEGDEIDLEAWDDLLGSAQATALRTPVAAARDAALWIFRPAFADREDALERLARAGALLHREELTPAGPVIAVVREDLGNAVRDVLALERFEDAWREAKAGRWPQALALADLSFVLTRGLVVERVALLSLALERVGRKTASDGLIEMAAGSRGAAFGEAVRTRRAEYEVQCHGPMPHDQTSLRRYRADMYHSNTAFLGSFRGGRAGSGA